MLEAAGSTVSERRKNRSPLSVVLVRFVQNNQILESEVLVCFFFFFFTESLFFFRYFSDTEIHAFYSRKIMRELFEFSFLFETNGSS